jgi:hypothetical protein
MAGDMRMITPFQDSAKTAKKISAMSNKKIASFELGMACQEVENSWHTIKIGASREKQAEVWSLCRQVL